jgi:hypothetical protein
MLCGIVVGATIVGGSVGAGVLPASAARATAASPAKATSPATAASPAATSTTKVVRRLARTQAIPPAVQREIDTVHSVEDLLRVSAAARKVVQTPVVELIETGKTKVPATLTTGAGKIGKGCYEVWVSHKRKNALGWVLMSAKTTVGNWCIDGANMKRWPTPRRTLSARWGWQACGWDRVFDGWTRGVARWASGADARFSLTASCSAAGWTTVHSEVQLYGNGKYTWRT